LETVSNNLPLLALPMIKRIVQFIIFLLTFHGYIFAQSLSIDFESSPYSFTNFDGGVITLSSNPYPEGNASENVAQIVKNSGQTWAGSSISLEHPIDFSISTIISIKVFSPRIGATLRLRIENSESSTECVEVVKGTTAANEWETLYFEFPVSSPNNNTEIIIIFDDGIMGDGSGDFTFLIDDIIQVSPGIKSLSDLLVDGLTLDGFKPEKKNYSIQMASGTISPPEVTATAQSTEASLSINQATGIPGTAYVLVTSQDSTLVEEYQVHFSFEDSGNITKSAPIPPTRNAKDVISIYSDAYSSISKTDFTSSWNTSTIVTELEIDNDTVLKYKNFGYKYVKMDSVIDASSMEFLHLDLYTDLPTVFQLFCFSGNSYKIFPLELEPGNWYGYNIPLSVFSELVDVSQINQLKFYDGGVSGDLPTIYIDNIYIYKGTALYSDARLEAILYNIDTIPGFHPDTTQYNIELPSGTESVPEITALLYDTTASANILTVDSLPGTIIIQVTAEDGTTRTYQVTFTVAPNNDASLAAIFVEGNTIQEFHPDSVKYTVELPFGSDIIPSVTAFSNDALASVDIIQVTSLPDTAFINVTAEDGTIRSYKVIFIVALCPIHRLDINANGIVDIDDLKELLRNYQLTCDEVPCPTDFNDNGVTEIDDLKIMVRYYGLTCEDLEQSIVIWN
jgi:hypothetical protein